MKIRPRWAVQFVANPTATTLSYNEYINTYIYTYIFIISVYVLLYSRVGLGSPLVWYAPGLFCEVLVWETLPSACFPFFFYLPLNAFFP